MTIFSTKGRLPIITAVQMNSQQDIDENINVATQAVKEAKNNQSDLVVLPENIACMGKQKKTAERYDELKAIFSNLAKDHQIHLVAGTLPCCYRPNGNTVPANKLRQVSLLFAPDGSQIARYDKIHLFKAEVNDQQGHYDEGLTFEAGTELSVSAIELQGQVYKLGLMICFDLRFPKMVQNLRQMGATILTAPSAFTYETGKANWSLLLQARALDSQCLVVGAGQGGVHQYQDYQNQTSSLRETWGHTSIARCDGKILQQYDSHLIANTENQKKYVLVSTEFDYEFQQNQRNRLAIFDCHRLV